MLVLHLCTVPFRAGFRPRRVLFRPLAGCEGLLFRPSGASFPPVPCWYFTFARFHSVQVFARAGFFLDRLPAAKGFLRESGVPSWSFGVHWSPDGQNGACGTQTPQDPVLGNTNAGRKHRRYTNVLFEGCPKAPINDSKDFLQAVKRILAEAACGDACIRFKQQQTKKARTLSGQCDPHRCDGCNWRLLATIGLDSQGQSRLLVKCDGEHGKKMTKPGSQLWTETERDIIHQAFPGSMSVTASQLRAAFAAKGAQVNLSALVRIEPKTDGTSTMLHPFSSLKFQRFDSLYPI